jgi:hypothetical protein
MAGESIYFDLASLCAQAALPLDPVRLAHGRERKRCARGPADKPNAIEAAGLRD